MRNVGILAALVGISVQLLAVALSVSNPTPPDGMGLLALAGLAVVLAGAVGQAVAPATSR